MSAKLNLASQPFRNRSLPWTIAVGITCISLIALFFIISKSNDTNAQADAVERDNQKLNGEANTLQAQASEVKEALSPEQLRALQDAQALIDRKRFSWSRLFADLEAVLPAAVRVTRINVRDVVTLRGAQSYAELDLAVVGKNTDDVTRMITEMDRSGVFQAEPLSQNPVKEKNQSGTEWTLKIFYRPRTGALTPSRNDETAAVNNTSATRGIFNRERGSFNQ
ncbi:MAG: PilN domain-containing protein [Pyrinomonadaceae bacterium]